MPPVPRIPVIVGTTAGGKTSLAVACAAELGRRGFAAEVVTADAYQIYRGMDIGTAKPTAEERGGVPHHLLDIIEPTERFTVHDWLAAAEQVIGEIRGREAVPIVVGGTNLYVKAFLEGLFQAPEPDEALRETLRAIPQADRRAELERVDPAAFARIDAADNRRTIRALEVHRQTGTPISDLQKQWDDAKSLRPGVTLVGLEWPTDQTNTRINARVKQMFEDGLEAEVRGLWDAGRLGPQAVEALGYKQLIPYFQGICPLDEARERIKIETRRFAKNQRTWLRRLHRIPESVWIDAPETPVESQAQTTVNTILAGI